MSRLVYLTAAAVAGGWVAAAPVPADVKALVAQLSDPSDKVRDEAAAALRGRDDALPWVRRAARSADEDTARRAAGLLAAHEPKRQAAAAPAVDACIKSGLVDLFMEWHHYWQPESKDDLWPVGPRMARAGQEEYARRCPPAEVKRFEEMLLDFDKTFQLKPRSYDGPLAQLPRKGWDSATANIRTDLWWKPPNLFEHIAFASVAGPASLESGGTLPARFFVLGSVSQAAGHTASYQFVVCDGDFDNGNSNTGFQRWGDTAIAFVTCHGNFRGRKVLGAVVLVDGDVELFDDAEVNGSLIRARGEIRIPKTAKVVNSTIEPHAKNATAPYKFFELADVGLSLRDDEEGMVVADLKPDTPFGASGLQKGDVIRAIDDARPGGHSSEFRKKVRRAMVRQGDCLLTVARGDKTLDLPVYFPPPK